MNVYEDEPESAEGEGSPKRGLAPGLRSLSSAEKLLALAAAIMVVAYLVRGEWGRVLDSWFDAGAMTGALGALALVALHVSGTRLLAPRARMYGFAAFGLLPAVGFVVEEISLDAWRALMLAGAVAMGLAAAQLPER